MSKLQNYKSSALMYIDLQNVMRVDKYMSHLLAFLEGENIKLEQIKLYYNSQFSAQEKTKKNLLTLLAPYPVVAVDIPYKIRNSADNQLVSDVVKDFAKNRKYKAIFISGDGDFTHIITILSELGVKTLLFSDKNCSSLLREKAERAYYLEEIPNIIAPQPQNNSNYDRLILSYQDAIQHLIESIECCLIKKKQCNLANIANLMKSNLQISKKLVILKPDGKGKFAKFIQFVDFVSQQGLIIRQGNQLILAQT